MSITEAKVVIDTNIFITILGRKSPNRWIFDKIINSELQLCVSSEILFEYEEILIQKTSKDVARNVIDFLLISPNVHLIEIFYYWNLIEADTDDNKFIDCAISSNAYCLVSNDKHFKVLKDIDFPKINILRLEEFESEFK
jgi:putative PIN family toxin of toxin-antitoxin system